MTEVRVAEALADLETLSAAGGEADAEFEGREARVDREERVLTSYRLRVLESSEAVRASVRSAAAHDLQQAEAEQLELVAAQLRELEAAVAAAGRLLDAAPEAAAQQYASARGMRRGWPSSAPFPRRRAHVSIALRQALRRAGALTRRLQTSSQ